jgi:hypothetical protein
MINNGIDVVTLLSRNREDWGTFSNCSIDEFFDIFLLSDTLVLILNNDVNFVLYDNNLIEVHNLYGSQMLSGLRLWAWLIASYQ